jgi:hypothetical protein
MQLARVPPPDRELDNPAFRFFASFGFGAVAGFLEGLGDGLHDAFIMAAMVGVIAGGIAFCGKRAYEWVFAFLLS